jgi:hypothetical protein
LRRYRTARSRSRCRNRVRQTRQLAVSLTHANTPPPPGIISSYCPQRQQLPAAPGGAGPGLRSRLPCQCAELTVCITSRHDLKLTTARQSEQGCRRRHVPGLRPSVHNRRCAESIQTQTSSMTLKIPQRYSHPGDLVIGRCDDRPRSYGRPRPAPRRRSCAGTWLPARLGELSLASGHVAVMRLPV